jgi:crotonobetaine/carnitine-CoA ligase
MDASLLAHVGRDRFGPEFTLPVLLRRRAAENPDRPFIDDVSGRALTYGAADAGSRRWAAAFRRHGIGPEDIVTTMIPSGPRSFLVWQGLAWIRAHEATLNEQYRGEFLAGIVNDTGAALLVVDGQYVERFAEIAGMLDHLREVVVVGTYEGASEGPSTVPFVVIPEADFLAGCEPAEDLVEPGPADIAAIFYTSGTTGRSKGVLVPWGCLHYGGIACLPPEEMTADDVIHQIGSASHTGSRAITYLAALVNARIVLRPTFSISSFWDDVDRYEVTTAVVVGAMPHFIAAQPPVPRDAKTSLTKVFMAPVVPDVDGFNERFGVRTRTVYGMTEIGVPITGSGFEIDDPASCGLLYDGFPWPEVRLVDDQDFEVRPGEVGEMIVRTPIPWMMNAGYLNRPDQTATAWRNGWFHTGDAMRQDSSGRFYFVDRIKDAIRRSGENISSFEVEAAINSHPGVAESAAVAVPSEYTEDEILVFVLPSHDVPVTPDELIDHVVTRVPRFMVPRYLDFVDELPKTPNEKIKKAELRSRGVTSTTWDRRSR